MVKVTKQDTGIVDEENFKRIKEIFRLVGT